jgi:hypothetical protein
VLVDDPDAGDGARRETPVQLDDLDRRHDAHLSTRRAACGPAALSWRARCAIARQIAGVPSRAGRAGAHDEFVPGARDAPAIGRCAGGGVGEAELGEALQPR